MSPRSAEFMIEARRRLVGARAALNVADRGLAVSAAYYAMLFAARAALSELDLYARTHRGIWHLFHGRFVTTGRFEARMYSIGAGAQKPREDADYDAVTPSRAEVERLLGDAEEFVEAVGAMLEE
ncbi:MAG: HEPN domain-containing protein [Solirubrobacteraceae bacterium]